jgi:dTDP-4-dehydrorhamnose reductase
MVHQLRPDWVFNSGAYMAIDKVENEPELAHAVNGGAPLAFAEALAETGGRLLQVSTDFVFNDAQGRPYRPEQPRDPLGIYGASKAAGEEAVEHVLGPSAAAQLFPSRRQGGEASRFRNPSFTLISLNRSR